MGTAVALPISSLVNVQVSVAAAAAQAQNTTSLLVLTGNTVLPLNNRIGSYSSVTDVAETFGSGSTEEMAADAWFGQVPQPTDLLIGRWVKTPAAGQLWGAPLTPAQQEMANWTTIVDGTFEIAVDNGAPLTVEALNFSGETNLNGVASQINSAMNTAGAQAHVVWNGSQFVFTSSTTGPTSKIPLLVPGGAGDISLQLGCTAQDPGAASVDGQGPESALDAVVSADEDFGYSWYALVVPEAADADHLEIAPFIQATEIKHFYGITTQDARTLLPNVDTGACLAQQLEEMPLNKVAIQYSSSSNYAVISMLARIMTTDYTQNNSVITLMYKQEPTIAAEYLNRTQLNSLLEKNTNVFVAYQGGALIIQPGTTCTQNQFIDTIIGLDNLAIDLQINIFNLLYTVDTKVPQTDAGMNMIVGAAENVLISYVSNGFLAPGQWTQPGFGALKQNSFLEKGYYIYCPPLAMQSATDRAARMAGPLQVGVKLAGAIHTVDATIFVNP